MKNNNNPCLIEWINCTFFYRELYIFVHYFFIFLSDVERYTLLKEDLCCWKWTCLIQNKSNFILGNFDIYILHTVFWEIIRMRTACPLNFTVPVHCMCNVIFTHVQYLWFILGNSILHYRLSSGISCLVIIHV